MSYRRQEAEYFGRMESLGVGFNDADRIRRDTQVLHTWAVNECNGYVERDEEDGRTYRNYNINGPGPIQRYRTADRETPARNRIEAAAKRAGLVAVFQGDPRGSVVVICKPEDVKDRFNYRGVHVPVRNR